MDVLVIFKHPIDVIVRNINLTSLNINDTVTGLFVKCHCVLKAYILTLDECHAKELLGIINIALFHKQIIVATALLFMQVTIYSHKSKCNPYTCILKPLISLCGNCPEK